MAQRGNRQFADLSRLRLTIRGYRKSAEGRFFRAASLQQRPRIAALYGFAGVQRPLSLYRRLNTVSVRVFERLTEWLLPNGNEGVRQPVENC